MTFDYADDFEVANDVCLAYSGQWLYANVTKKWPFHAYDNVYAKNVTGRPEAGESIDHDQSYSVKKNTLYEPSDTGSGFPQSHRIG